VELRELADGPVDGICLTGVDIVAERNVGFHGHRRFLGQAADIGCAEDRLAPDDDDVAVAGDRCGSSNDVRELLAVHRRPRGFPTSWERHASKAARR
jgi:hypothetical protein